MGALMAAFLTEVGIITYRDVAGSAQQKQGHTISSLPLPADYLAAVMLFGGLSFFPEGGGQRVAGLLGWGIVVATALNLWSPASPLGTKTTTTASPTAPTARKA